MYCEICGKHTATDTHHLISGSNRSRADEDKLTLKLCRNCHNDIHNSATAATLSKMVGQLMYESSNTREQFLKRYGKSYF